MKAAQAPQTMEKANCTRPVVEECREEAGRYVCEAALSGAGQNQACDGALSRLRIVPVCCIESLTIAHHTPGGAASTDKVIHGAGPTLVAPPCKRFVAGVIPMGLDELPTSNLGQKREAGRKGCPSGSGMQSRWAGGMSF